MTQTGRAQNQYSESYFGKDTGIASCDPDQSGRYAAFASPLAFVKAAATVSTVTAPTNCLR
jgi:hypothetical protein